MFYLVLWLILWLMGGATGLTFGSPVFWSFVVALIADLFIHGLPYVRRA